MVRGEYNHHKAVDQGSSVIPCSDMCGVVQSVGSGATKWNIGDRVLSTFIPEHQSGKPDERGLSNSLGHPQPGVLATHRVFAENALVKAPEHMSDAEASTLPIAAVTAWMSINGTRPLGQNGGQGEYILLQGTGGVSIAGLQLAKASGAKGTSLSDARGFFLQNCIRRLTIACSYYHFLLRREAGSLQRAGSGFHYQLQADAGLGKYRHASD